jgi:hypothetical protein
MHRTTASNTTVGVPGGSNRVELSPHASVGIDARAARNSIMQVFCHYMAGESVLSVLADMRISGASTCAFCTAGRYSSTPG